MSSEPAGIRGPLAELYDVFVDWPGRLRREMPGILGHLERVGARRVLDVGCGTGRHVAALREAGLEAHGADASEEMLVRAREAAPGGPGAFHLWRLGDDPPAELARERFDAVIAMGNVWPQVLAEEDALRAAAALRSLLRPGGLVLAGLKALAVREERGDPYLPLLRRERDGRPLWFVRFVDFALPTLEDGTRVAGFHMVVVEDGEGGEGGALAHRSGRSRVWSPDGLREWFAAAGFEEVRVSGSLLDRDAAPATEDVFLSCRTPADGLEPTI